MILFDPRRNPQSRFQPDPNLLRLLRNPSVPDFVKRGLLKDKFGDLFERIGMFPQQSTPEQNAFGRSHHGPRPRPSQLLSNVGNIAADPGIARLFDHIPIDIAIIDPRTKSTEATDPG